MTEAVILAGGLGSRLKSVVSDVPKPMALVAGKPFLEHQMHYWADQGVNHFILSVGYKWEIIRDYFGDTFKSIPVSYAVEKELAGTGGGLLNASTKLAQNAPFLILNGDTYCNVNLEAIRRHHEQYKPGITMVVKAVEAADRYGLVEVDDQQRLLKFCSREESGLKGGLINTGIYLSNPDIPGQCRLKAKGKTSLEADIFPVLVETRRISAYCTDADFIDIGIPGDYARCAVVIDAE